MYSKVYAGHSLIPESVEGEQVKGILDGNLSVILKRDAQLEVKVRGRGKV